MNRQNLVGGGVFEVQHVVTGKNVLIARGLYGTVIPRELLANLLLEGSIFMDIAPTQDDVWLSLHATSTGFSIFPAALSKLPMDLVLSTYYRPLTKINAEGGTQDAITSVISHLRLCQIKKK